MPSAATRLRDPESPAALIGEIHEAAVRTISPPALGPDGKPTAYGELVREQFQAIADRFCAAEGTTIADALAFSFAARKMLGAFQGEAGQGNMEWNTFAYATEMLDRLHECLQRLVGNDGFLPRDPFEPAN